jgi:hypothetical protein
LNLKIEIKMRRKNKSKKENKIKRGNLPGPRDFISIHQLFTPVWPNPLSISASTAPNPSRQTPPVHTPHLAAMWAHVASLTPPPHARTVLWGPPNRTLFLLDLLHLNPMDPPGISATPHLISTEPADGNVDFMAATTD